MISRSIPLKETQMKTLFSSLLLSVLLAMQAGPAAAETTLAGKWQGWLEVQPGRIGLKDTVVAGLAVPEEEIHAIKRR